VTGKIEKGTRLVNLLNCAPLRCAKQWSYLSSAIPSGAPEKSLLQVTLWRVVEGPRECVRYLTAAGSFLQKLLCYDSRLKMAREHEYWMYIMASLSGTLYAGVTARLAGVSVGGY
jgi:hypothetical protein